MSSTWRGKLRRHGPQPLSERERLMKWLLVWPGQEALVRLSLSAAATGVGYPMKLSALLLLSNGLKPKATELPRARYSCGLLEAARAVAGWAPKVTDTATPLKSVKNTE